MSHQSSHTICYQLRLQFKYLLDIGRAVGYTYSLCWVKTHSVNTPMSDTTYIATWRLKKTGTTLTLTLPRSARLDGLWRYLWLCLWPPWSPALLKISSLHTLIMALLFIAWYSCQFMCCFHVWEVQVCVDIYIIFQNLWSPTRSSRDHHTLHR